MATKMDGTAWRPLGPQTQNRMRSHDIICLHTMVGYLTSTDAMFKQNGYGGAESHFGIGGKWGGDVKADLDGVIYQWQDLDFTADANLDGNHRVISIETADNAPKSADDLDEWTPKQCAAIIKLVAALCKKYNIPAVIIPDTKPGRRGIAFHAQGIEPRLVSGGEKWSAARGKVCPGTRRIAQITKVIIPGVVAALNQPKPKPKPTVKESEKPVAEQFVRDEAVTLGGFAKGELLAKGGVEVETHKAGALWQWGAAHASQANKNSAAALALAEENNALLKELLAAVKPNV